MNWAYTSQICTVVEFGVQQSRLSQVQQEMLLEKQEICKSSAVDGYIRPEGPTEQVVDVLTQCQLKRVFKLNEYFQNIKWIWQCQKLHLFFRELPWESGKILIIFYQDLFFKIGRKRDFLWPLVCKAVCRGSCHSGLTF